MWHTVIPPQKSITFNQRNTGVLYLGFGHIIIETSPLHMYGNYLWAKYYVVWFPHKILCVLDLLLWGVFQVWISSIRWGYSLWARGPHLLFLWEHLATRWALDSPSITAFVFDVLINTLRDLCFYIVNFQWGEKTESYKLAYKMLL